MIGRVTVFLAVSFGFSWGLAFLMWLLKVPLTGPLGLLFAVLYMWGPALGALAGSLGEGSVPKSLGLRLNFNGWWLAAVGFPLIFSLLTIVFGAALPGVRFDPDAYLALVPQWQRAMLKDLPFHPAFLALVNGLMVGPTLNAVVALGEEVGWRGFLYGKFRQLGFWRFSALVGALWGLWHAPMVLQGLNYPEIPVAGVFLMILWCLLLAPVFTYIRDKAGSAVAAAVAHGTLNAVAGLPLMILSGPRILAGSTGLAGFLALAAINLVLLLVTRRGNSSFTL